MFSLKYSNDMDRRRDLLLSDDQAAEVYFNLERMNPQNFLQRLVKWLGGLASKVVLWIALHFLPWLRIGRLLIIARHADVEASLKDTKVFEVSFNPEMTALANGATFMLGLDGDAHMRQRNTIEPLLTSATVSKFVTMSTETATRLLTGGDGRINIMQGYFTRTSAEACAALLGLELDNPDLFAEWSIAMSAMVFGDPLGDKVIRELASHAAWRMRPIVDSAISGARAGRSNGLLQPLTAASCDWSDAEIRAFIMGVAIGVIPTVTLMAGNVLEYLLENPAILDQAIAAARTDETALRAILLEAARLRPALDPGQFRLVRSETRVTAANGKNIAVPANTVVLVATAGALRDERQFSDPNQFKLGRALDGHHVNLIFGAGPHACAGRQLAIGQLVAMFAVLLRQDGLAVAPDRYGRLTRVQAWPRRLDMVFGPRAGAPERSVPLFKYNDDYRAIRRHLPVDTRSGHGHTPLPPFSLDELNVGSIWERLQRSLSARLFASLFPMVRACPPLRPIIARFLKVAIVARAEDVCAVLSDDAHFQTPFALEMTALAGGSNFLLGLEGDAHTQQLKHIQSVVRSDDLAFIRATATRFSLGVIENSEGKIEVMGDYFQRVTTEVCFRYFGFRTNNSDDFAHWAFSVSNLLFADPTGTKANRALGHNGAARLRLVIDDAIDRSKRNPDRNHVDAGVRVRLDTNLVDRLVDLSKAEKNGPNHAEIRAILLGMVVGFIPTVSLAAGRILEEMIGRPEALAEARMHAEKRDDTALLAVLMELARLNPALAPGQWRYCHSATTMSGFAIPAGLTVAVGGAAALRDPRLYVAPGDYDPARQPKPGFPYAPPDSLVFGFGSHGCVGTQIAKAVLVAMFGELLRMPGLQTAAGDEGTIRFTGPFPTRLLMTFDAPQAIKSMFFVVIPIARGARATVDQLAKGLGHPAHKDIADALDKTGIVHFSSLSILDDDDGAHLIFELTVDGLAASALETIVDKAGSLLKPIFAATGANTGGDLVAFLLRHVIFLHGKPWGPTGLDFQGLPGISVQRIRRTRQLADTARTLLDDHLNRYVGQGTRAMRVLTHVRRAIMQDQYYPLANYPLQDSAMKSAREQSLDAFLLIPSCRPLAMATFRQPTKKKALWQFLQSSDGLPLTLPVTLLWLGFAIGLLRMMAPATVGDWKWALLGAFLGGLLTTTLLLAVVGFGCRLWLRRLEKRDVPDERAASTAHIEAIATVEDQPGYSQNHIFAYGTLKPGGFRVLVHCLALWLIGMICKFYYRPGFVLTMGTIHSAHWWRIPGTRKVAFHANYDGSWDSYLEDFITRVPSGQTGAWSNWIGFPFTKNLTEEGARDGERFKRWVRTQQHPAAFWYTAFRDMTTDQIRTNALIHQGLATARTDDEAREWLRLFGSRARQDNSIESDEIQSLVFEGLKRLPASTCLQVRLPVSRNQLKKWHSMMLGSTYWPDDEFIGSGLQLLPGIKLISHGKLELEDNYTVTFGDKHAAVRDIHPGCAVKTPSRAAFLALSGLGIARYRDAAADGTDNSPARHVPELFDNFPAAFRLGMAGRARTLGDAVHSPAKDKATLDWRWADGAGDSTIHGAPAPVDAVLLLYATDQQALDAAIETHSGLLQAFGGAVLGETPTYYGDKEHFGYRDGISQPAVRGTGRFAAGVPERDVVEPGEFILGYGSDQGYRPLSPLVRGEIDIGFVLPTAEPGVLSSFPDFGSADGSNAPRDFGRNGSFLVIRELQQDVDGFNLMLNEQVRRLTKVEFTEDDDSTAHTPYYRGLDQVIGQTIDVEWLAAKLMGRWRDGRPLVGHPLNSSAPRRQLNGQHENDFTFGKDDPIGLACPFAAHIRRANPRDSKQPSDDIEQKITNRHRLLRRGRNYDKAWGEPETGMVFMALCANLERQFEFIQQTWMNSPSFHGLEQEPDAFVGHVDPSYGDRCFTIPTAAGPVRLRGLQSHVTPRAGGYFFLPGRSALMFLEALIA